MKVRITDLDCGFKVPNLALMKIAKYHSDGGGTLVFARRPHRELLEADTHHDRVYGSIIFRGID